MKNGATKPMALSTSGSSSRTGCSAVTLPITTADHHAADRGQREGAQGAAPGGRRTDRRGQRHLVGGQRGRVVEQALARRAVSWCAAAARACADRRRRDRVGRRDDRAERQRRGDREFRHRLVGHHPDGERRRQRQSDGEQPDRAGCCCAAPRSCSPAPPTTAAAAGSRTAPARGRGRTSSHPGIALAASPATTSASGAETSNRRARAASRTDTTRTASSEAPTSPDLLRSRSPLPVRILDQHVEEITPARARSAAVPDTVSTSRPRSSSAEPAPRTPGHCEECAEHGEDCVGAPADVHDVRPCRLLRLEPAPARHQALPPDRPSGHALGRTGRELAVVLHRRPGGVSDLAGWSAR